jgi:hypothetical protein
VVTGAACDSGTICSPHTPTPTPTPCLKDNGDGTITDACTKRMWEKKDQAGGLHDNRGRYTWAGACTGNTSLCQPNAGAAAACAAQTGGAVGCDQCVSGPCIVDPDHNGAVTTIWDWLSQLNASTFAGYDDWRIPGVGYQGGAVEFETILGPTSPPCEPKLPVFNANCTSDTDGCSVASCSCTADTYWSATTFLPEPGNAEQVDFILCGGVGVSFKTNAHAARAVRNGS